MCFLSFAEDVTVMEETVSDWRRVVWKKEAAERLRTVQNKSGASLDAAWHPSDMPRPPPPPLHQQLRLETEALKAVTSPRVLLPERSPPPAAAMSRPRSV